MIFKKRWKGHLQLIQSNAVSEQLLQSCPIKIEISSFEPESKENCGTVVVKITNVGATDINEIYCDFHASKGFVLFYQEMYLGSDLKHWKIDQLTPGQFFCQKFNLKINKTKWNLNLVLILNSFHTRHGQQEVTISSNFELEARKSR